ncbi:hypothetical protein Q3G72_030505 [Acer saccharum]|nr:hypothetical protein Q3G72_030505 [Acer saccharum]
MDKNFSSPSQRISVSNSPSLLPICGQSHMTSTASRALYSLQRRQRSSGCDPRSVWIQIYLLKDIRSWGDLGPVGEVDPGNVLITSIVKRAKIEQLNHLVTTQSKANGGLLQMRMSTFVVTCAFMWVNLMRLQEKISGGLLGDDILYYFVIASDCRQQLAFPISGTYFGNCLAQILVSARRGELMGESGIAVAAKAIARKILEFNKGALIGAEKWVSNTKEILKHGRLVSVAGTPKFRVYDTDFGWGKPKKYEYVHIGAYGSFSLVESRQEEGGVEIGVVVGRDKLDIFNDIFEEIRPLQSRI